MKKNNPKRAFTLAEVLVTLAIIGVVAALTVPIVFAKFRQHEYKTAGKKAFSELSAAIQTLNLQYGLPVQNFVDSSDNDKERFYDALENTLNIVKRDTDADGHTILITNDGFAYHIVNTNEYYVDVNSDKSPTKPDTPMAQWRKAEYEDEDDLFNNAFWDDVELSDMFFIGFNPQTGTGVVLPYVDNAMTIAFPNAGQQDDQQDTTTTTTP